MKRFSKQLQRALNANSVRNKASARIEMLPHQRESERIPPAKSKSGRRGKSSASKPNTNLQTKPTGQNSEASVAPPVEAEIQFDRIVKSDPERSQISPNDIAAGPSAEEAALGVTADDRQNEPPVSRLLSREEAERKTIDTAFPPAIPAVTPIGLPLLRAVSPVHRAAVAAYAAAENLSAENDFEPEPETFADILRGQLAASRIKLFDLITPKRLGAPASSEDSLPRDKS